MNTTDPWLLHKIRVSCSACADWPRAPQKHKQRATRKNPGVTLYAGNAETPSHDAERQMTRENFSHTQHLPEHGSARLQLRETRALAKREEKTSDLGAHFFFVPLAFLLFCRLTRDHRRRKMSDCTHVTYTNSSLNHR